MFAVKDPIPFQCNISQTYLAVRLQALRDLACVVHGWICSSQPCCGWSINALNWSEFNWPFFLRHIHIHPTELMYRGTHFGECCLSHSLVLFIAVKREEQEPQVDPRWKLPSPRKNGLSEVALSMALWMHPAHPEPLHRNAHCLCSPRPSDLFSTHSVLLTLVLWTLLWWLPYSGFLTLFLIIKQQQQH